VPVGFKNGIWQISCKSDQFLKSDTVLRVMSAFQDAGAKCAFVHENQGKLTWYPTWAEKALSAAGLLVIFSHSYQTEFTEALMMEARLIQALFLAKRTTLMVYVPDGPNPHKPAEVASSVMKQQHGFGPIEDWLAFVNANAKSADELRIADVLARVTALARPTGPTDGLEAPLALLLLEKGASLALLGSTLYAHNCRTVAACRSLTVADLVGPMRVPPLTANRFLDALAGLAPAPPGPVLLVRPPVRPLVDLGTLPPLIQAVVAGLVLDLSEAQAVEVCAALMEAGERPALSAHGQHLVLLLGPTGARASRLWSTPRRAATWRRKSSRAGTWWWWLPARSSRWWRGTATAPAPSPAS
jgi:hypothetical protein